MLTVDPAFGNLVQANSAIKRLWTGALWAEGPAWCGQGRYLVWSDIPNNRQLRWLEDDEQVTVFRSPSNNSNGNTFDFAGRQLSCEHLTRRVVRYEHDGSTTVIAESYNGKRLNSPNDVAAHPDGSYWFTDPPYGRSLYRGTPEKRELPTAVYRADGKGGLTQVVAEEQVPDPNGIAFSPDYKKLYVASTGRGPGDAGPGGKGNVFVFDVTADNTDGERARLLGVHDRRRQVRAGWRALRRGRQRLVLEQRRPRRRLQRRDRLDAAGQTDRPHPPAGSLRQSVLRRPEAQSPVHGREPIVLRGLCEHAGRGPG